MPANYPEHYGYILNGFDAGTFTSGNNGTLPTSAFTNNGIIGGSIERYSNNPFAYDQSNGSSKQFSGDVRFNTNFEGPVNFMVAAYYLKFLAQGDYFVGANTLDYGQTLIGAIGGPPNLIPPYGEPSGHDPVIGAECAAAAGCVFGTPYYDNNTERSSVESKAIYGEAYWDNRSRLAEADGRSARHRRHQGVHRPHRHLQRL